MSKGRRIIDAIILNSHPVENHCPMGGVHVYIYDLIRRYSVPRLLCGKCLKGYTGEVR